MIIQKINNIQIDSRLIAKIDANGKTLDIRIVDRGEKPAERDNYLAVRAYGMSLQPSQDQDMFVQTEIIQTEYDCSTHLKFCGTITDISSPESIVDPYFHDLQLNKIIHISTPDLEFDIDGFAGDIPEIGARVSGTADFMGILINKEKAGLKAKACAANAFVGSFTSPCTVIIEEYLKAEALRNPEKFLSGIFQGREEFVSLVFNKGADLIGCEHFLESDFQTQIFPAENGKAICAVISLPGAKEEFDYSVIALKTYEDTSKAVFYTLEKGDESTYLLRKTTAYGASGTVDLASDLKDPFEYVCNYLHN